MLTVSSLFQAMKEKKPHESRCGMTGIEENVVAVEPFDVYDLSGRKVLHQVTSLDGLADGIYIVNGKKILKKK